MGVLGKRVTRRVALAGILTTAAVTLAVGSPAAQAAPRAGLSEWTKLDLDGVRINALATDPSDANTIFAGTNGGNVFRTTDGGQSWQPVNSGLANSFVNDLSVDPTNPQIILAGTGRGPAVGEPTAAVYRTTNRGDSWTATLPNESIHAIARTPQNPQIVYAGGGRIFKSTDGGVNWTPITSAESATANADIVGIAVSPFDPNVIVAVGNTEGGTGQVFRSTDGGATWTMVLGALAPVFDVAFAPPSTAGPVVLFANQVGVFRSTDGGVSFQRVTEELGDVTVFDILFNPNNASQVFIGTQSRGVFQSNDGGVSWTVLDGSLGNQTVRGLALDQASPQTLYAGTESGVFEYTFAPAPPPPTARSWFFAEGSTQPPFDTWFLVQNPTNQPASVRFTFQLPGGGTVTRDVTVGPTSRFSLFANQVLPNSAFSTRIDSDQEIFAERSMFVGYDGHVVTGIPGTNQTWLFAEGSTQDPFHTWLLLQNPNGEPANVTVTYLLVQGSPVTQTLTLPPNSRTSIFVNQILPNAAFSARVDSDQPIVAERAMFRFPGNAATGVSGVNAPSQSWYFAAGNTTTNFDTWLLLQNPNSVAVTANVTLLDTNGNRTPITVTLPPTSRQSIFLNQIRPSARFGIVVEANQPIVAEKSLFFGTEPRGAAATQGTPQLATTWNLAEGSTQPPFREEIAILNPNAETMNVHVDFQLPNGQVIGRDFAINPGRSFVVDVNDIIPNNAVSARITTSLPSAVERTMFFNKQGSLGGHNTIGIR